MSPTRTEEGRGSDHGCNVLHLDLDAFFASVEVRDHPELRGLPVVVGGGLRGVVLAATYEARRFGVRSGMPMTRARRLCPGLVVARPHSAAYEAASVAVHEILWSVTPNVQPLSPDEAFLDVTGASRLLGRPVAIAEHLRHRIADEIGIAASVGIAPNPFLAKLASRRAKPDGLWVVPVDGVVAFLHPMLVGELWGVGERTEAQLLRLGIRTVGDLAHVPQRTLVRALGPAAGTHLAALSWGRDERRVVAAEPERSVGAQETFGHDVDDLEVMSRELLRLADRVGRRLRRAGALGRTVTLTVRFADFNTITRSRTLPDATDVTQEIYGAARALLVGLGLQRARVRLVGVRIERLVDPAQTPRQLVLGAREHGWADADRAADRAVVRFGRDAVRPASLVGVAGARA